MSGPPAAPRAGVDGEREQRPVGARAVWVLTVLGTLATAVCFYPGYLDGDSNWQYRQGVTGEYADLHPVFMSWLMGRLDHIVEGAGGYFLLLNLGFWAGLGITLRAFTASRAGFVLGVLWIAACLPLLSMLGQVQKDVGMVVGLLGAFALLVLADRRRSLSLLLGALPCLWFALAVRHDGVTAGLPLALFSGWLLARDHLPPRLTVAFAAPWRRLALGLAILATLVSISALVSRAIMGEHGRHIDLPQFLMAYDMVGISVRSDRNLVSDVYYPKQPLSMAELRAIYDPKSNHTVSWAKPPLRSLPRTDRPEMLERIRADWRRAILAEPGAYLAHRAILFLAGLGLAPGPPVHRQPLGLPRGRSFDYRGPNVFDWPHARALVAFLDAMRATLLFRPWPYLAIGAIALAVAWTRPNRNRLPATLLAASSASYLAPLFVIGVASELRYLWWPILSAMLQVVVVLDGRSRRSADASERS